MNEPNINVGIVNAQEINFSLNANYSAKGETVVGEQVVTFEDGGIRWRNQLYQELTFVPMEENASFSLYDVTIGINFHWERQETQIFQGTLKLVIDEGKITAINILPVEEYLISVISSEMKATSPLEFLKAHAVVSRSWLYAQIERHKKLNQKENGGFFSFKRTDDELIRWYDREDHTIFDVCADDHCQRYQGITKATSETVMKAVKETCGEVLMYGEEICDARFSKCCGGATEEFEYCWDDRHYNYLESRRDYIDEKAELLPDLTNEKEAEKWIRSAPASFCKTQNKKILSQILNHYDRETTDFYRWQVCYTQKELASLINERMKADFGEITDLIPLQRGKSGRITRLQICGTKHTMCIGKELEIRRTLSSSHLFSSAFVVDKKNINKQGIPQSFTLTGAGWGHGVGLCQIGAAVMGEKGYKYNDILLHYFKGAEIKKQY